MKRLQAIVASSSGLSGFDELLRLIVDQEYWRQQPSNEGRPFGCFPRFLTAAQPHGLGVDNTAKLQPFLDWLKRAQRYGLLNEVVEAVRRRPGAQNRTNIADSDICVRFYTPDSSSSSLDQLLPRLAQYPDWFARVCAREISPHKAAQELGLLGRYRPRPPVTGHRRFGVMDLEKLRQLAPKSKLRLACEFFDALDENTQCGLLSQRVEPRLEPGLAERWRNHHAGK